METQYFAGFADVLPPALVWLKIEGPNLAGGSIIYRGHLCSKGLRNPFRTVQNPRNLIRFPNVNKGSGFNHGLKVARRLQSARVPVIPVNKQYGGFIPMVSKRWNGLASFRVVSFPFQFFEVVDSWTCSPSHFKV